MPLRTVDGFIYNFLSMGVIFPWAFLQGRAAFPGANVWLALAITLAVETPLCVACAGLASAMPVRAGDYCYQRLVFGRKGSVIVLSGLAMWGLQWVAISGWLFTTLGLVPVVLSLAVHTGSAEFISLARLLESSLGTALVSILLSGGTVVFLWRGLRFFVILQRFLFVFTLASVAITLSVFCHFRVADPIGNLNAFAQRLFDLGHYPVPQTPVFTGWIESFSTPPHAWSFFASLGIVPIAWMSLQWATYSVEQNDEISGAGSYRKQLWMMLGSAVAVAGLMVLVAQTEGALFGDRFLDGAARLYQARPDADVPAATVSFLNNIFQPFPNFLAVGVAQGGGGGRWGILVAVVASLGFLANALQVTCNCFIGMGRILFSMAEQGDVPRFPWWKRTHPRPSLRRAYLAYLLVSVAVIAAYNWVHSWNEWAGGVTFGCGYAFAFTSFAAGKLAWEKCRHDQDGNRLPYRLIARCGHAGALLGAGLLCSMLLFPQYQLLAVKPFVTTIGVIGVSAAIVYRRWLLTLIERRFHPERVVPEKVSEVASRQLASNEAEEVPAKTDGLGGQTQGL